MSKGRAPREGKERLSRTRRGSLKKPTPSRIAITSRPTISSQEFPQRLVEPDDRGRDYFRLKSKKSNLRHTECSAGRLPRERTSPLDKLCSYQIIPLLPNPAFPTIRYHGRQRHRYAIQQAHQPDQRSNRDCSHDSSISRHTEGQKNSKKQETTKNYPTTSAPEVVQTICACNGSCVWAHRKHAAAHRTLERVSCILIRTRCLYQLHRSPNDASQTRKTKKAAACHKR